MAKVKGYGCKSIVSALCLQFQLAGHGLRCSLRRTEKGQWVVEAKVRDYTRVVQKVKPEAILITHHGKGCPCPGCEYNRTMTRPELNKGHGPWDKCLCVPCRQAGQLYPNGFPKAPQSLCECRQGRDPCTCRPQGVAASVAIHGGA